MRIGITYDLKSHAPLPADLPDDFQEEFDSPTTIEAIAEVLRELGHTVEKLGDGRELLERLLADPCDLVFNFAEGQGIGRSREARVPAVLEMLGIPYTGSCRAVMEHATEPVQRVVWRRFCEASLIKGRSQKPLTNSPHPELFLRLHLKVVTFFQVLLFRTTLSLVIFLFFAREI